MTKLDSLGEPMPDNSIESTLLGIAIIAIVIMAVLKAVWRI